MMMPNDIVDLDKYHTVNDCRVDGALHVIDKFGVILFSVSINRVKGKIRDFIFTKNLFCHNKRILYSKIGFKMRDSPAFTFVIKEVNIENSIVENRNGRYPFIHKWRDTN